MSIIVAQIAKSKILFLWSIRVSTALLVEKEKNSNQGPKTCRPKCQPLVQSQLWFTNIWSPNYELWQVNYGARVQSWTETSRAHHSLKPVISLNLRNRCFSPSCFYQVKQSSCYKLGPPILLVCIMKIKVLQCRKYLWSAYVSFV